MADNNDIPAYPYMFDPSQILNKYSNYAGKPLPWPSQYSGVPTDAHGNPIQSYVDAQNAAAATQAKQAAPVTLNSTPQSNPTYSAQQAAMQRWAANQPNTNSAAQMVLAQQAMAPSTQQAAPQAAAQPAAPDMSAAYLQALSNPGKVTTPGATVAQAPTPTGQSSVLQQFLQNWQNKGQPTQGAGNYNNSGFFNALQGTV